MSARVVETVSLQELRPWPRNARAHSRKQIRQIAESIRRFGFTNPVLIDGENHILAGHGRVEAAREMGMTTAPCLRVDYMSAAEKRAYVLADNKLALNAGWDEELLALELKELMSADIEFSVDVTGFSIAEVDQLIDGLAPEEPGDPADDELSNLGEVPSRCQLGDVWRMGPHQLVCGDALDPDVVSIPYGWRKSRDGLHRSALQCRDRRQRGRPRQNPTSRVRDGLGRDDARRVCCIPLRGFHQSRRSLSRWINSLRLHGLAAHGRDARSRLGELCRAQEPYRLGKG
jgi:ParB-like nuclease family protein